MANEREEALLHFLLTQNHFVTVASITKELAVSAKTVYRLIKKINSEAERPCIRTEKGKGVRLLYDAYLYRSHRQETSTHAAQEVYYNFSPLERRLHIIKELLFYAPRALKEVELFAPYYLSPSAIYVDEGHMLTYLQKYGLELKRKERRLSIQGTEPQIRKALTELLAKLRLMDFDDLKSISVGLQKQDLRFAMEQVELIEREIDSLIPAPYNVNLLTHLYILIYRAGKGGLDN